MQHTRNDSNSHAQPAAPRQAAKLPRSLPIHLLQAWGLGLFALVSSHAQVPADAVQAATDAFGTSIGRESIGIYTSSSVRGFSPTVAGNVRIEGLYFDPVADLIPALRQSTQLRVGLSAQSYVLPAPTGIVEHRLRRPGAGNSGTVEVGLDHLGSRYVDLNFSQALRAPADGKAKPTLALTGGASLNHAEYGNTNAGRYRAAGLALWWQASEHSEAALFTSVTEQLYDEAGPQLLTADGGLPPEHPTRDSDGPHWARYQGQKYNHGAFFRSGWQNSWGRWQLQGGAFRSSSIVDQNFAILLEKLLADGSGRRVLIADPPSQFSANSGELRLSWTLGDADLAQRIYLLISGRQRERSSGGSQRLDVGPMRLGEPYEPPKPDFQFGPMTRTQVRQLAPALSYEMRWQDRLELNAGLQQARYQKQVQAPGATTAHTASSSWLGNLSSAWHLTPTLALYAGTSRGLEESGIAPSNASNRGQAMPAILTQQVDAGLRWQWQSKLKLVAGLFRVKKPYYNLNAQSLFTELGEVQHQGLEFSLSGEPSPRWRLIAGGVLMQPRVSGEAVQLGRVGRQPVAVSEQLFKLNAVWRFPFDADSSLDGAISHLGPQAATLDNRHRLPAFTKIDLGLRSMLRWGGLPSLQLRIALSNALDARGHRLLGAGNYFPQAPRVLSASLQSVW